MTAFLIEAMLTRILYSVRNYSLARAKHRTLPRWKDHAAQARASHVLVAHSMDNVARLTVSVELRMHIVNLDGKLQGD